MNLRKYVREILKESFQDSNMISVEEVFDLIEYHDSFKDLYPGYNPEHENEYAEDYYYPSKEKAYEEVGHVLSFFVNLPNPIPVYRAIQVKSLEDIRYDYLGDSWTYERQSALDFAENHNGGNVLISAKVTKDNVDWKATLKNNFLFSEGMDSFDENEIKVEDTDLLIDVKVEWIKKSISEIKEKAIFKIPEIPGTTNFWHGGNLDTYDDVIAQKNGRYEYGPGLYLTTQFEVAEKYAKGSRKMYLVTVANGVDIRNAILSEQAVQNFIKSYIIGSKRKEIWDRLQKYRVGGGFKAYVFNNIILNEKAIKSTNTAQLRQFYVDNGIDYELVDNAFGWGETMMVLYNMKKIVQATPLKPGETPEKYNFH